MSDARTPAIHKAATELVQELLSATGENGGERWYHLIVRKMMGLPTEIKPDVNPASPSLRVGKLILDRFSHGATVSVAWRDKSAWSGERGCPLPEKDREVGVLMKEDLAKLKLWLDGERP